MISLHLPTELVRLMGSEQMVHRMPEAGTLGDLLLALEERLPGVCARICEPDGHIRRHMNVFVGDENARLGAGLSTTLRPDDDVWVMQAISGG